MKKYLLIVFLLFLCVFSINSETNFVKSNEVSTGLYKYNDEIFIEYVMLEDIDEAIIYSYREQDDMDDRIGTRETSATLENALTEFCRLNLSKISRYKIYHSYKMLKRELHYNVKVNNNTYVIFESRVVFYK